MRATSSSKSIKVNLHRIVSANNPIIINRNSQNKIMKSTKDTGNIRKETYFKTDQNMFFSRNIGPN